jgi:hypothetical protein
LYSEAYHIPNDINHLSLCKSQSAKTQGDLDKPRCIPRLVIIRVERERAIWLTSSRGVLLKTPGRGGWSVYDSEGEAKSEEGEEAPDPEQTASPSRLEVLPGLLMEF